MTTSTFIFRGFQRCTFAGVGLTTAANGVHHCITEIEHISSTLQMVGLMLQMIPAIATTILYLLEGFSKATPSPEEAKALSICHLFGVLMSTLGILLLMWAAPSLHDLGEMVHEQEPQLFLNFALAMLAWRHMHVHKPKATPVAA